MGEAFAGGCGARQCSPAALTPRALHGFGIYHKPSVQWAAPLNRQPPRGGWAGRQAERMCTSKGAGRQQRAHPPRSAAPPCARLSPCVPPGARPAASRSHRRLAGTPTQPSPPVAPAPGRAARRRRQRHSVPAIRAAKLSASHPCSSSTRRGPALQHGCSLPRASLVGDSLRHPLLPYLHKAGSEGWAASSAQLAWSKKKLPLVMTLCSSCIQASTAAWCEKAPSGGPSDRSLLAAPSAAACCTVAVGEAVAAATPSSAAWRAALWRSSQPPYVSRHLRQRAHERRIMCVWTRRRLPEQDWRCMDGSMPTFTSPFADRHTGL